MQGTHPRSAGCRPRLEVRRNQVGPRRRPSGGDGGPRPRAASFARTRDAGEQATQELRASADRLDVERASELERELVAAAASVAAAAPAAAIRESALQEEAERLRVKLCVANSRVREIDVRSASAVRSTRTCKSRT